MATSKKITELVAATAAANADLLYIVADPSGVPTSKKITVQNLLKTVNAQAIDAKAANAYSNAVAEATSLAANAYVNATSAAATFAGNAYTNAIANSLSSATSLAGNAYSNAVTVATALAGNAYSNAVAKLGTLSISNNVLTTTNSSATITLRGSNTPLNIISNSYVQLHYNANSFVSEDSSSESNWLYVDSSGISMEVINSSSTVSSLYVNTSAITLSVNSKSWAFASNGELTFPDSTVQSTAAASVNKNVSLVTSTAYSANATEEIILCDPNAAGNNITLTLPNTAANGKIYTIKNINDGGYDVYVEANGQPNIVEVHGAGTFNTYDNISQSGNVVSWVYYDGYYRVISSA